MTARLTFSFAPTVTSLQWMRVECTAARFVDRFRRAPSYPNKDALPRWCAATLRGGRRRLADVERVHMLVLDVDHEADGQAIARAFGGVQGFAHSTWSSTPMSPRFRVVLFLARPITVAEHDRVWRWGAIQLERMGHAPDYAARDAVHAWACPGVPVGVPYEFHELHGKPIDVDAVLPTVPAAVPVPQGTWRLPATSDVIDRARRWLACVDPAVSGQGGHRATFRAALGLVRGFGLDQATAFALLAEYNERCQPPWSPRELVHKVREASQRSRLEPGWLLNAERRAP